MRLIGEPEATARAALAVVGSAVGRRDGVLWVSDTDAPPGGVRAMPTREVVHLLGRAFDAVVLDLHTAFDADLLGQVHGMVWGGGALVFRTGGGPPSIPALAVEPFAPAEVGRHLWDRFTARVPGTAVPASVPEVPAIGPPWRPERGSVDQQRAWVHLAGALTQSDADPVVLLARRGRGKSAALGLALRALGWGPGAVVTAADHRGASEVLAFAGSPLPRYVEPDALATGPVLDGVRVIAVDEAAALPVPLLRRIVARHPDVRFAFATTTDGYEGTGQAFVLRFLAWLRGRRPVDVVHLHTPIRWADDDPLEAVVRDVLLMDARPSPGVGVRRAHAVTFDRDRLAADERMLSAVHGLLVHAHHRTTASDLHRLLDAPNLSVHAIVDGHEVVGASVTAREGGLSADRSTALARGGARIRGHALPDTLVTHSGEALAGTLTMVRSVRIAVHPDLRRQGWARQLVAHVHATSPAPDLFGTVFGATPGLVRFRRAVGYVPVRIGLAPGVRSGEPAVVLLRPVTPAAHALVTKLSARLARDLELSLALLAADGAPIDEALAATLRAALPAPAPPPTDEEGLGAVRAYAHGPRPFDAVAADLAWWTESDRGAVATLPDAERRVLVGRAVDRRGWVELAGSCGFPSVKAAMRAVRRAVAGALDRCG